MSGEYDDISRLAGAISDALLARQESFVVDDYDQDDNRSEFFSDFRFDEVVQAVIKEMLLPHVAALGIYADPVNWEKQRTNMGHGDNVDVLRWKGPKADFGYCGPSFGPEYAQRALGSIVNKPKK